VNEPIWIRENEALALHQMQIRLFGGSAGVRDSGLLASALARPKNSFAYAESSTAMHDLAAGYAYGISANHPFIDGNKRVAMHTAFLFLEFNGIRITATQEDAYLTIHALAAGDLTEEQLAAWFVGNTAPRP
jgi:death on curing protein